MRYRFIDSSDRKKFTSFPTQEDEVLPGACERIGLALDFDRHGLDRGLNFTQHVGWGTRHVMAELCVLSA